MKDFVPRYLFFLLICLGIFGCQDETDEQQIGQEYLDSESYRQFEEKTKKEIVQKEKLNDLPEHLPLLADCQARELSLPLVINRFKLNDLQAQAPDCDINSKNQDTRFTLSILGKNNLQNIDLYWVLVDWESSYTNQEILAVSFQKGSVLAFQTIGVFQDDLSKEIATETEARLINGNIQIISKTQRQILYPIEQNNTITTEFMLTSGGSIREISREVTNERENKIEVITQNLQQLPDCSQVNELSIPIEFTQKKLAELKNHRAKCEFIVNGYNLAVLGKTVFRDLDLYWIEIIWESMNVERDFLVVAFLDGNLRSYKKVGAIKKGFDIDIITEVYVQLNDEEVQIISETSRRTNSPIIHENLVKTEYNIDSEGTIQEL